MFAALQVYRKYCDTARLTPGTVAIYVPRVTEILEFFADEDGWRINVRFINIFLYVSYSYCK